MPETRATAAEVLEGLVDPGALPKIAESLAKPSTEIPGVLLLMMGAGAWVAALAFMAFLRIADLVTESPFSLLTWGLVLMTIAAVLRKRWIHPFGAQLCLALIMLGYLLLMWGVQKATESAPVVALASVVVAAVLYTRYRDAGSRFLSVLAAAGCAMYAALDIDFDHAIHGVVLLEAAALAGVLRRRHVPPSLVPLMCALAVSILATLWVFSFPGVDTTEWPSKVVCGAGLVAAVAWAGGRTQPVFLLAAGLFAAVGSPGMSAALALMVLGAARRERLLEGIGTLFFPAFLFFYYYSLHATLLEKSLILMGCGVVLLGAWAWVVTRWKRPEAAA